MIVQCIYFELRDLFYFSIHIICEDQISESTLYHQGFYYISGYLGKSSLNTGLNGGGGANVVCLHHDPQWPEGVRGGFQSASYMTGGEYEYLVVIAGMTNKDIPCISCIVQERSQKIMIPGRVTCEEGWTWSILVCWSASGPCQFCV